ncbi:MAG: hypothetical protein BWK78_10115 [Thiotrichaceae bacterium IS1]|nr:MAG: hypothetical protein BWK78_10115 [Thiotrichaceae bacterium IS1]
MTKYQEESSLLEVREWKEQCRLERSQWTDEEYLKNLKEVADSLIKLYHIKLRPATLSSAR